jgi:F0F1-type ATP synthase assembly protein I
VSGWGMIALVVYGMVLGALIALHIVQAVAPEACRHEFLGMKLCDEGCDR